MQDIDLEDQNAQHGTSNAKQHKVCLITSAGCLNLEEPARSSEILRLSIWRRLSEYSLGKHIVADGRCTPKPNRVKWRGKEAG